MSKKLWTLNEDTESYKSGHREYIFHCPGCKFGHRYITHWSKKQYDAYKESFKMNPPVWTFNNDFEKPTFRASLLNRYEYGENKEKRLCHLYVTDGQIQFLSDCTHHLAGKTVEMQDIDKEE